MKPLLEAAAILLLCAIEFGCYGLNSAATTVSVVVSPDGTCRAEYSSNKEQVGLEAAVCGGMVRVEKSGSNEAIAAGSIANQAMLLKIFEGLMQKAGPVR